MSKKKAPKPPICPYCKEKATFSLTSNHVYNRNYGPIWECKPCIAWVGCHPNTHHALGTPAREILRRARNDCHRLFDYICKTRMYRFGGTFNNSRRFGYYWLAEKMNIEVKKCHFGYFVEEECFEAIRLLQPVYDAIIRTAGFINEPKVDQYSSDL